MANELLLKYGTPQLLFADHGTDFGAAPTTAANSLIIGSPTDIQIDLTSVAATGGARQSAKSATLGATRAPKYRVDACLEFAVAPSDGDSVAFYWAGSPSATAGTGNPGGCTGTDAAFTDTDGNLGELIGIGSLSCRNNVIAIGFVGYLIPDHLYGSLVVVNNADQALHTVMDEAHITFTPVLLEVQ